jgi:exopolysaccharide biosynthesis polyprenyl glycosylphosphotransferase
MLEIRKEVSGLDGGALGATLGLGGRTSLLDSVPPPHSRAAGKKDKDLAERLLLTGVVLDAMVIAGALLLSFWLRFCTPIHEIGVPAKLRFKDYTGHIAFGAFSLQFAMVYFKVYDRTRLLRFRHTAERTVKACALWFVGFLAVTLLFKFQPPVSRIFVVISSVNVTAGLLCWRYAFHRLLQHSKVAAELRQRVLFVGWNAESQKINDSFEADLVHPYEVVGCVPSPGSQFRWKPTVPVLGEYSDLNAIFKEQSINTVLLCDVDCVRGEIVGLANLCERAMVSFKIIPSYFQILVSGLHLETVSGVPVLGVSQLPLDVPTNFLIKRMVDIIGATIGLILSLPLILIFGVLVYLESPGPIFYTQRRVGRAGRTFNMIKIRSMRLDAERDTGARWCVKDDPRRLRVGAVMRAWNIDEVPQFWNVLKGEMSLVGPRPERPELIENFKDEIPHYNARHNAKPGITGWAQVKGLRGDTDLGERIRADLYYLENWNVLLDFQVMIMTFFNRENAG